MLGFILATSLQLISQESMIVEYNFRVEGECGMCKDRIEGVATSHPGVSRAEYNLEYKMLSVDLDENISSVGRLRLAIANAGHDNGGFLAPDEAYNDLPACCYYKGEPEGYDEEQGVDNENEKLFEFSFIVDGICGMCEERIEKTASLVNGVKSADWNLASQEMLVVLDENKTSIQSVRQAIANIGHDNGEYIAPQEAYDNLHGCCKYREDELHNGDHENKNMKASDGDHLNSQPHNISGNIFALDANGLKMALIGATVKLAASSKGTTTDINGYFELDNTNAHTSEIEISYVGFSDKTVKLSQDGIVEIILREGYELDAVEITYKKRSTEVSFINTINSETITREELCKAACCNLSESFETNPSVDVAFSDAISGTRQIQMLGLAGPYVQITRELIPDIRAMSSIYGLSMTPGPWIQGIQLIKGVGSVVNGFESIAGQINVELKKPDEDEIFHLNGFLNQGGRIELNSNYRVNVSPFVSTSLLLHGKRLQAVHDQNQDGFTDMPLENDFVVANRWKFSQKGNIMGQLGVKISSLNHEAGDYDHFAGTNNEHDTHWRMDNKSDRYEAWGKFGYINPNNLKNSIGLQFSVVDHTQDSKFGSDIYNADQQSLVSNLIYQNIYEDENILRFGLSYQLDDISERVGKAGFFERNESVPGAFVEYTFQKDSKFAIIPGLRIDHHNNYSWFITPRLHAKYNFSDKSIVRITGGRGLKTANIFAENLGLFSSSREVIIQDENNTKPYGLDAEVAWNYGINFTQGIYLASRELIVSFDVYRTEFENQVIVDYETAGRVSFYNLSGSSYSNSIQLKLEYEIIEDLTVRTAYRIFDVQADYNEGRLQKPMISKHRAFVNAAYKTKSDWFFDATLNWNGSKRLPNTSDNPEKYRRPDQSPNYFLFNAQIMKRWGDKLDIYLGGENLLGYQQKDAIIAADDAFGQYFDASIVWAPLFGRNIYIGFRFNINK